MATFASDFGGFGEFWSKNILDPTGSIPLSDGCDRTKPSKFDDNEDELSEDATTIADVPEDLHANYQDLLYVEHLSSQDILKRLYSRFLSSSHFTFFGNCLFYVIPKGSPNLAQDVRLHLYERDDNVHLFSFLNEILQKFNELDTCKHSAMTQKDDNVDALVRKISGPLNGADSDANEVSSFSIFIMSNTNYGQSYVIQTVASYLTQACNTMGMEPSGDLAKSLEIAHQLLAPFDDFSTLDEFACNKGISYRFNFDENNRLYSVMMTPNWGTDHSCATVAYNVRYEMGQRMARHRYKCYTRPPSILYAVLYALEEREHKGWLAKCFLSPQDANYILSLIPKHEQRDVRWHILTFENTVTRLLKIGLTQEDIVPFFKTLCAIVLFDVYSILRNKSGGPKETELTAHSVSTDKVSKESANSKPSGGNPTILGKDVLGLCLKLLDINLLSRTSSQLSTEDILFKVELTSQKNQCLFDNVSSNLYIRLKHYLYRSINKFCCLRPHVQARSCIYLHCNGGAFSYEDKSSHPSVELAQYFSDDALFNVLERNFERIVCENNGEYSAPKPTNTSRVGGRIKDMIASDGILTKLIWMSQSHEDESQRPSDFSQYKRVSHSWGNVEYDMGGILKMETSIFSLKQDLKKLFGYSQANFVSALLRSKHSLHPNFGKVAAAMSYYIFLQNCMRESTNLYLVFCSNLKRRKKKGEEMDERNRHDVKTSKATKDLNSLEKQHTCPFPVLEKLIEQRDGARIGLYLDEFLHLFMPLAYISTPPRLHKAIANTPSYERVKLLFRIIGVDESSYQLMADGSVLLQRSLHVKMLAASTSYMNKVLSPVLKIQAWWIGYTSTIVKKQLKLLITRIQSHARRLLYTKDVASAIVGRQASITFIGLVMAVYHLSEALSSSSQHTLQLLHSMEKRYHDKEYSCLQYAAATFIQANWRGALARRQFAKIRLGHFQEFAIVLLQSYVRHFLASVSILHRFDPRVLAATRIQAHWRGYKARCNFEKLKDLKLCLASIVLKGARLRGLKQHFTFMLNRRKNDNLNTHVKKLIMMQSNLPPTFIRAQNLVRMWFVRRQYVHLKKCLEKLHAIAMTKLHRTAYIEKLNAAKKIQRWWRTGGVTTVPTSMVLHSGYYINLREAPSINLLRLALKEFGICLFTCTVYRDLTPIYPKMWAKVPLEYINHARQVARSMGEAGLGTNANVVAVDVAIGASHSLLLLTYASGETNLYSWGFNTHGQLARPGLDVGTGQHMLEPIQFPPLTPDILDFPIVPSRRIKISAIACGVDFSLAVTTCAHLYAWGDNRTGQCGLGPRLVMALEPQEVVMEHRVAFVKCGDNHSIVGDACGNILTFGVTFGEIVYTPTSIATLTGNPLFERIKTIDCGGNITCLVTQRLDYAVYIYGSLHTFGPLYSLPSSIQAIVTNGSLACALVQDSTSQVYETAKRRLFVWGQLRCVLPPDLSTGVSKAVLVSQYRDMFESNSKQRVYKGPVSGNIGKVCNISSPVELNLPFTPAAIAVDARQIIVTALGGAVYGMQNFELIPSSFNDIVSYDEVSINISPNATKIQLSPILYQFVHLGDASGATTSHGRGGALPKISVAYNKQSLSVAYTRVY